METLAVPEAEYVKDCFKCEITGKHIVKKKQASDGWPYYVILLCRTSGEKTPDASARLVILLDDLWARYLQPILFVKDYLHLKDVIYYPFEQCSSMLDKFYIATLQRDYEQLEEKCVYFSSHTSSSKIKINHKGFPQSRVVINWRLLTEADPFRRFPAWAQDAVQSHFAYSIAKSPAAASAAIEKLATSSCRRYAPLCELMEDVTCNIFGVIWEILTPMQHHGAHKFTNVLVVDESFSIDPSNFSRSEIVRTSLQIIVSAHRDIPIPTAGDIVRILSIEPKRKKNRFLDLNFSKSTTAHIWSGNLNSPPVLEAAYAIGNEANLDFDPIHDSARIIELRGWFHALVEKECVYTNSYLYSLERLCNRDAPVGDLIVKIVRIKQVHQFSGKISSDSARGNKLILTVKDNSFNGDAIISLYNKQPIQSYLYGWQCLRAGDWIRLRNVKVQHLSTHSSLEELEVVPHNTPFLVFTRLPIWCKDVVTRQDLNIVAVQPESFKEFGCIRFDNFAIENDTREVVKLRSFEDIETLEAQDSASLFVIEGVTLSEILPACAVVANPLSWITILCTKCSYKKRVSLIPQFKERSHEHRIEESAPDFKTPFPDNMLPCNHPLSGASFKYMLKLLFTDQFHNKLVIAYSDEKGTLFSGTTASEVFNLQSKRDFLTEQLKSIQNFYTAANGDSFSEDLLVLSDYAFRHNLCFTYSVVKSGHRLYVLNHCCIRRIRSDALQPTQNGS